MAEAVVVLVPAEQDVGQTALANAGGTEDHDPGAGVQLLIGDHHLGPGIVLVGDVGGRVQRKQGQQQEQQAAQPAQESRHRETRIGSVDLNLIEK